MLGWSGVGRCVVWTTGNAFRFGGAQGI